MIADSTPRSPPPRWPINTSRPAPAWWNQPTRPLPQIQQHPREWWPYAAFGGTTVMIVCLAAIVVMLGR